MSIPPQNRKDNFVRYSSDLTGFTRQSSTLTKANLSRETSAIKNQPNNRHLPQQQNGYGAVENFLKHSNNEFSNGHMSTNVNMLDNNMIPLHQQGREAMENFAETLQMQLIKKIEECESKDNKIKQLHEVIQLQSEKLKKISLACTRLKEENETLKQSDMSRKPTSTQECVLKQTIFDHQGILDALRLLQQRNQSWNGNEQSLQSLKDVLKSRILTQKPSTSLDVPNKEWRVGKDFVLLGDKPLNYSSDGDRDGSCSLVFLIRHNRKEYVLKVSTIIITLIRGRLFPMTASLARYIFTILLCYNIFSRHGSYKVIHELNPIHI